MIGLKMDFKRFSHKFLLIVAALFCGMTIASSASASAKETIKIGVLHSLSGTMAISETTLKDTILMLVDEQNKKRRTLRQKD